MTAFSMPTTCRPVGAGPSAIHLASQASPCFERSTKEIARWLAPRHPDPSIDEDGTRNGIGVESSIESSGLLKLGGPLGDGAVISKAPPAARESEARAPKQHEDEVDVQADAAQAWARSPPTKERSASVESSPAVANGDSKSNVDHRLLPARFRRGATDHLVSCRPVARCPHCRVLSLSSARSDA